MVSPAEKLPDILTHPCSELVLGVMAICEVPPTARVPPEISIDEASMEPFAPAVGPLTVTTPPVIVMVPFESRPSPEAFTVISPPIRIIWEPSFSPMPFPLVVLPDVALSPSSEEVAVVMPPAMTTFAPSIASTDVVILVVPPAITKSPSA